MGRAASGPVSRPGRRSASHARGPLLAPQARRHARRGRAARSLSGSARARRRGEGPDRRAAAARRRRGRRGRSRASRRRRAACGSTASGSRAPGALEGTLVVAGGEIAGELRGEDVDLAKVARLAGVPLRVAGLANVDVELASSRPGSRRGHVDVELAGGEARGIEGLSGLLSARFDGDRVRADGLLRLVSRALPRRRGALRRRRRAGARCRGRPRPAARRAPRSGRLAPRLGHGRARRRRLEPALPEAAARGSAQPPRASLDGRARQGHRARDRGARAGRAAPQRPRPLRQDARARGHGHGLALAPHRRGARRR